MKERPKTVREMETSRRRARATVAIAIADSTDTTGRLAARLANWLDSADS